MQRTSGADDGGRWWANTEGHGAEGGARLGAAPELVKIGTLVVATLCRYQGSR